MTSVDAYASREHYADHLAPVAAALRQRGVTVDEWAGRGGAAWGTHLSRGAARGLPRDRAVLVASASDAHRFRGRRVIYLEHGAGQSYGPGIPGYSGGPGLDHVALFLAPNDTTADRWRAEYRAPVAVVGCPKLDRWHAPGCGPDWSAPCVSARHSADRPPEIAITFHWDCRVAPEARSALPHYSAHLGWLAAWARDRGIVLYGHAHPRIWARAASVYRHHGIATMRTAAGVLDQCELLIGDNTSLLYEFASLDRPVVVMNAPWYRRDVEHGLRFWSHIPGIQVDDAAMLPPAIAGSIRDPSFGRALRRRATRRVYAAADGHAAARAADAIMGVL